MIDIKGKLLKERNMLVRLDNDGIVNLNNITRIYPVKPYNDLKYKLCFENDSVYITENDYNKINLSIGNDNNNNNKEEIMYIIQHKGSGIVVGVFNNKDQAIENIVDDQHGSCDCDLNNIIRAECPRYKSLKEDEDSWEYEIIEIELNKRWD